MSVYKRTVRLHGDLLEQALLYRRVVSELETELAQMQKEFETRVQQAKAVANLRCETVWNGIVERLEISAPYPPEDWFLDLSYADEGFGFLNQIELRGPVSPNEKPLKKDLH